MEYSANRDHLLHVEVGVVVVDSVRSQERRLHMTRADGIAELVNEPPYIPSRFEAVSFSHILLTFYFHSYSSSTFLPPLHGV
jgi:hypothetical protein